MSRRRTPLTPFSGEQLELFALDQAAEEPEPADVEDDADESPDES